MRKLLFATTALVATAGVAAAQDTDTGTGVTVSGTARLGVIKPDDDSRLQFVSFVNPIFTMTTTTDTGLTFGASIELADAISDQGLNNTTQSGESVFITGPFGTLTLGDTDGAFDWALQEAEIGASLGDVHRGQGYSGNDGLDGIYDGQIARYEFAFGDFGVAVSAEIDDEGIGDAALGIGGRYATSFAFGANPIGLAFGVGYQTARSIGDLFDDDDDNGDRARIIGASADVDFGGGFRGILNYSQARNFPEGIQRRGAAEDFEHVGVALGYTVDLLTVGANFGRYYNMGDDDSDVFSYGVTANYDLGGGAQARFGYGYTEDGDGHDNAYSAGIQIAF